MAQQLSGYPATTLEPDIPFLCLVLSRAWPHWRHATALFAWRPQLCHAGEMSLLLTSVLQTQISSKQISCPRNSNLAPPALCQ